jgi:hypothetical protein
VTEANEARLNGLRLSTVKRSQLLSAATLLYRWSKEQQKSNAQRDSGYQERDRLPVTERLAQMERRYDAGVDRVLFDQALIEYRKVPADKRNAEFEAKLAEIGVDKLYANTKLGDSTTRAAWLNKSAAEFEASDDPFIQLAVAACPNVIADENKAKARSGRIQAARSVVMEGQLAFAKSQGRTLYPDANGSLRFTYGKVTGKTRDGQIWTPFTTAEGVVSKQTGRGEFNAPDAAIASLKSRDFGTYSRLWILPTEIRALRH